MEIPLKELTETEEELSGIANSTTGGKEMIESGSHALPLRFVWASSRTSIPADDQGREELRF
jgi:hypothetical protein